ncbi:MAG: hypothetical protein ACT4OY_07440 [Alphaproteobacteria bacterium]
MSVQRLKDFAKSGFTKAAIVSGSIALSFGLLAYSISLQTQEEIRNERGESYQSECKVSYDADRSNFDTKYKTSIPEISDEILESCVQAKVESRERGQSAHKGAANLMAGIFGLLALVGAGKGYLKTQLKEKVPDDFEYTL